MISQTHYPAQYFSRNIKTMEFRHSCIHLSHKYSFYCLCFPAAIFLPPPLLWDRKWRIESQVMDRKSDNETNPLIQILFRTSYIMSYFIYKITYRVDVPELIDTYRLMLPEQQLARVPLIDYAYYRASGGSICLHVEIVFILA